MGIPATLDLLLPWAARNFPRSGAITSAGSFVPWPEVHAQTVALAGMLADAGVGYGDRVAVLHPKSLRSFEAMHAAIRLGAIAVPLDPLGAVVGIESVLDQISPTVVVGNEDTLSRLAGRWLGRNPTPTVAVPPLGEPLGSRQNPEGEPPPIVPTTPAYLIFTSGSTGRPKGILHTHRSAMAYAKEAVRRHQMDESTRLAGIPPLHFDMSTLELYAAPLSGATIVDISEAELRFPATLTQRFERDCVTHVYAVPYLLRQVQERGALDQRNLDALVHISYGGETFPPGALSELMGFFPQASVVNVYGPAEVNAVTSHQMDRPPKTDTEIPLGDRWEGVDLCVVDEDEHEVPVGTKGELWISAPTCMTGYWNEPELTERSFVSRGSGQAPWYRSGDIVVGSPDGSLLFLGRRDNQVKIRGVRLELEAIEAVLTDAPGVEHAVVGLAADGDDVHLVAEVVLRPGAALDQRAIRRWCSARLAAVAIPERVVAVDGFPTTASGKIDKRIVRSALLLPPPSPAPTSPPSGNES